MTWSAKLRPSRWQAGSKSFPGVVESTGARCRPAMAYAIAGFALPTNTKPRYGSAELLRKNRYR